MNSLSTGLVYIDVVARMVVESSGMSGIEMQNDLEKLEEEEVIAREIRRKEADWSFIERLPPKLKHALLLYIEIGDEYKASRLAGLTLEEFEELRIRARIPKVVIVDE